MTVGGHSVGGVIVPAHTMGPGERVEYVQRLEALGYDSGRIPDKPVGGQRRQQP